MNAPGAKIISGIFLLFLLCPPAALAQNGQTTQNIAGMNILKALVATNTDGSGIRVAQTEAAAPYFEVGPASVSDPVSLFTYYSGAGTATTFTNTVGLESTHADQVASFFYGMYSGTATNVAHVDNFEANFFYTNYLTSDTPLPVSGDLVMNQSFTFGPLSVGDQQEVDSQYDNYAVQNNILFVSAADNLGFNPTVCAPGTDYNCISVGAYEYGAWYNSVGPTSDNGRCKPDITAFQGETSFSTPQVAGYAAVLMQAALRGDGGADTNSAFQMETIKALLLDGAVKPIGWTNSNAAPLDARYGSGLANIYNSYVQLTGGKHVYIAATSVTTGGAHPPNGATGTVSTLNGWDFNTNTSGSFNDAINHYYFNVTNAAGATPFAVAATLVWNRHYNANYEISPEGINNLKLFLYNCANSNLVNCSTSLVDNVQHIYMTNLPPGRYDLQVWKAGGLSIVSDAEPYALAWAFTPPPTLTVSGGASPALSWPVYPAGYGITASTNLALAGAWSATNLPASTFVNRQNYLPLAATNPAQFFRLASPNF